MSSIDTGIGERMKAAFRRFPTGVAVIAAAGPRGPAGLTASSVASVSLEPPALSFSVMGGRSARVILDAPSFTVNLLGSAHAGLAHDFARDGGSRFTPEQGWDVLPTGEPFLPGAQANLRVAPLHLIGVGDSTVVVAAILDVLLGPAGGRLVHHDREFLVHEDGDDY
ncbi:flavin reductase family protein [Actinoplanes xinjiangensis]|uniref:Flavin reductase (DIM6/NTAB) family NADH-FMN oxidoreductase RutF n=1 Tax=Actinoplanes xinjiangensis TaxID=512350 RepID=A0A316FFA7_9ACTN|nr:flavin reductase family protein [Actinoplanes xinjiangensis]PWK46470.1 flavin reductase (DIM6/NTAB) family NADH-FMN oxidoreductase RutF [Actinoplanes xinjiangensis]GIF40710.1 flavin oxidoreductase [Actinoplanes xinjiangensis]